MRWASRILIAAAAGALFVSPARASAPPPRTAAKETGVSATCRLRHGGTRFLLNASLSSMAPGVIVDAAGQEMSGSLEDYWKLALDKENRDGSSPARVWKKGATEPVTATIKSRSKSGGAQVLLLRGYNKDRSPQSLPLVSCSEVRIRE